MRPVAVLAASLALAACTAPAPVPIEAGLLRAGPVDPERITAPETVAAGQNCTLRKRASLPLTVAGLPIVTAEINGRPARLILDTGAEYLILSSAAARRLGVSGSYDFMRSMSGIGRSMRTGDVRLDSMRLGGVDLPYPRALVGDVALHLGTSEPDGLLGATVLGDFDLDIDLPHQQLTLYDRLDCATLQPPWSGRFVTLETTRSLSQHPFVPITINGVRLSASLDSGAQRTVVTAQAAARAGLGAETRVPGVTINARGAGGEVMAATLNQPREVRLGGVSWRGPVMVVPAKLPRDIDALLGLDFLLGNRVWLSYGSRRMFVQPG